MIFGHIFLKNYPGQRQPVRGYIFVGFVQFVIMTQTN